MVKTNFYVSLGLMVLIGALILMWNKQQGLPRGLRNNNPGNLKRNSIQWQGMHTLQTDPTFVQFNSLEYGIRALAKVLKAYEARGLNTVNEIISTYAPSTENNTDAYARFVAERLQIHPDKEISISDHLEPLIAAIITFENGSRFANQIAPETIQRGVALA